MTNPGRPFLSSVRDICRRRPNWLKAELVSSGAIASLVQLVGLLLVFFMQLLLARVMVSPQAYGQYVWGQNLLFLLGGITALGLPAIAGRQIALHVAQADRVARDTALRRAVVLTVASYVVLLAVVLLVLWVIPLPEVLPRVVVALAVVAAPFAALTLILQSALRAHGRLFWAFFPYQVLRPLLTIGIVVALLLISGRSLNAGEVLSCVAASLTLVLAAQWFLQRRPMPSVSKASSLAPTGPLSVLGLLRETLPAFGASLCTFVMTYSNVLAVGLIAGPTAAGLFFVAERLAQLSATPATVVSSVIQPWLARAHAERDQTRLQGVVTQAAHLGLWPTLVVVSVLWWFAAPLLGLFGAHFQGAVPVLATLLAAQALSVACGPAQATLIMSGHQALTMRIAALAVATHVTLLVALVPQWGALGAAWATLFSAVLDAAGCMLFARSRLALRLTVLRSLYR